MELSYRLTQIADMVTKQHRLADIGTDHAYVPIKLIMDGKIPSAIAMDVGLGPLQRAKEHVALYHLQDKIQCRLSDGLQKLGEGEADTIVIAGMGGELISRICNQARERFSGNKEFILQPQSETYKVRQMMHSMHYVIVEERFFMEDGKYYVCIKALPGTETFEKKCEYVYGKYLLEHQNQVLKVYLQQQKNTLMKIADKINAQRMPLKNASIKKLKEIEEKKDIITEALSYYN